MGEHPGDELELPARGGELALEEDRRQEGPEEEVDEVLTELQPPEPVVRRLVGPGEQLLERAHARVRPEPHHPEPVPERAERRDDAASHLHRPPERIGQRVELPSVEDQYPGGEAPEPERLRVEQPLHLGVRGQEDLEAAIDPEAVDLLGADASSGPIARLEDLDGHPRPGEYPRAGEAGQPRTHHHHVSMRHAEAAPVPPLEGGALYT